MDKIEKIAEKKARIWERKFSDEDYWDVPFAKWMCYKIGFIAGYKRVLNIEKEKAKKMEGMVKYLEELKLQVIQDCKGSSYCTGCGIWNPWEKKCNLFDNEYNNTDKICPRFIENEMIDRIRGKINEMFEKKRK